MKDEGKYILTDGERYIRENVNGRYISVQDLSIADRYKTIELADAILKNALPYSLKRTFYVAKIENGDVIEVKRVSFKGSKSIKKELSKQDKGYSIGTDSKYLEKWYRSIDSVDWLLKEIERRENVVSREISETDLILEDISHSYLYRNLDACRRCKRDVVHQKYEQRRRDLKNEFELIKAAREIDKSGLRKLICVAHELKQRVYKPRILTGLYEYGIDEVYNETFDTY